MVTETKKYELKKTRLPYFDVTEQNNPDATRAEHFGADFVPLGTCE